MPWPRPTPPRVGDMGDERTLILLATGKGLRTSDRDRPGGALTIGLDLTAKAEPDGYTIRQSLPSSSFALIR